MSAFPSTYMIVPSLCPEKTVQIQRAEHGKEILVCDRIPRGRENYRDQLWLWDGTKFQCAKHPSYCISYRAVIIRGKLRKYCELGYTGKRNTSWIYDWGTLTLSKARRFVMHLTETGNNSNVECAEERRRKKPCYWRLEMVPAAEPLNFGFGPFHREYTCVIVPAHSLGKTVHLDGGRTENGTKIVLNNRKAFGHRNHMNQLWLWDGKTFRSAKDPSKYLYVRAKNTHVELDDRRPGTHYTWTVKRNVHTGLCAIYNTARFGTHCWITDDLEGHNYTDIGISNQRKCFWKIEILPKGAMVPEEPERCDFGFTPSLL